VKPPYAPDHVEQIATVGSKLRDVRAVCSCGWAGDIRRFGSDGLMSAMIAELNEHRETYVEVMV
jgi:hypothetical protein